MKPLQILAIVGCFCNREATEGTCSMKTEPIRQLFADRCGATAIEYGLVASLIGIAILLSLQELGHITDTIFSKISDRIAIATNR